MRHTLRRGGHACRVLATTLLCAAALGACTDQPAAAVQARQVRPTTTLQVLECDATRGGVTCRPQGAGSTGASREIYGGQNQFVRLASSNAGFDSQTGIYSVNVTVQNLMNEAIGTPDGVTPDPGGIQVFFYSDIIPRGTGTVTVRNEDGTTFFTEANQPYHAYHEMLDKDEISSAKTWEFDMDPGVTGFSFTVLIETDVQYLLVINEVMANPVGSVATEQPLEWVELYNAGTRPVDLQDLVIADSSASGRRPYHRINASLVVPAGAYVVLGGSTNTTLNGGVPVDYSYGTALNQLANSLDAVKIARVVGSDTLTLDRTQYANASVSAQEGVSRELKNPALDNSNMDGSNWGNASVTSVYGSGGRGTPKAQNSAYTP